MCGVHIKTTLCGNVNTCSCQCITFATMVTSLYVRSLNKLNVSSSGVYMTWATLAALRMVQCRTFAS